MVGHMNSPMPDTFSLIDCFLSDPTLRVSAFLCISRELKDCTCSWKFPRTDFPVSVQGSSSLHGSTGKRKEKAIFPVSCVAHVVTGTVASAVAVVASTVSVGERAPEFP